LINEEGIKFNVNNGRISDKMSDEICKFCDPKLYVIYGICEQCGRENYPPNEQWPNLGSIFSDDAAIKLAQVSEKYHSRESK